MGGIVRQVGVVFLLLPVVAAVLVLRPWRTRSASRLVPVVALAVPVLFAGHSLVAAWDQTLALDSFDQHEAYLQPVDEQAVQAIRGRLGDGGTWAVRSSRECGVSNFRYFWLTLRLLPATVDCGAPDVELVLDGLPAPHATVAGDRWAVVAR